MTIGPQDLRATANNIAGKNSGSGCVVGMVIALVLTAVWPLLVFHRHWTTTRLINCATDHADQGTARGCVYSGSGHYSGTGIATVTHSSISATGWLAEVIWLAFLVTVIVGFFLLQWKEVRQHAVKQGSVPMS